MIPGSHFYFYWSETLTSPPLRLKEPSSAHAAQNRRSGRLKDSPAYRASSRKRVGMGGCRCYGRTTLNRGRVSPLSLLLLILSVSLLLDPAHLSLPLLFFSPVQVCRLLFSRYAPHLFVLSSPARLKRVALDSLSSPPLPTANRVSKEGRKAYKQLCFYPSW